MSQETLPRPDASEIEDATSPDEPKVEQTHNEHGVLKHELIVNPDGTRIEKFYSGPFGLSREKIVDPDGTKTHREYNGPRQLLSEYIDNPDGTRINKIYRPGTHGVGGGLYLERTLNPGEGWVEKRYNESGELVDTKDLSK